MLNIAVEYCMHDIIIIHIFEYNNKYLHQVNNNIKFHEHTCQ